MMRKTGFTWNINTKKSYDLRQILRRIDVNYPNEESSSMMKKIIICAFAGLFSSFSLANVETVSQNLKQNFPDIPAHKIAPTEMKGIYSLIVEDDIYYVNEDAQHILGGPMLRLKDSKNLTQQLERQQVQVDWKKLPLENAIKMVKGDGKRQLAIFSDPNCPYCKQLEDQINKLNNVTVYTFILPFKSQSVEPSKQIYCAKEQDRLALWQNYISRGVVPTGNQNCKNPINDHLKLASEIGVTGTPAIIFSNGHRVVGAMPAAAIEKVWEELGL